MLASTQASRTFDWPRITSDLKRERRATNFTLVKNKKWLCNCYFSGRICQSLICFVRWNSLSSHDATDVCESTILFATWKKFTFFSQLKLNESENYQAKKYHLDGKETIGVTNTNGKNFCSLFYIWCKWLSIWQWKCVISEHLNEPTLEQ